MDLVSQLRIQARANRLANHRLHTAMTALPAHEFDAPRTGFFPSLALTLNHILVVDLYYIAALHRQAEMVSIWEQFVPCRTLAELAARQAASDERLIALCESLDEKTVAGLVDMDRGTHVQRDLAGHVLAHVFMHQTHHRGQAHAMLSSTSVAPPQLDEFLMPSDAKFRQADMQALGWREEDMYG
jgi:uncharacterized damage-inducible protein DinB